MEPGPITRVFATGPAGNVSREDTGSDKISTGPDSILHSAL